MPSDIFEPGRGLLSPSQKKQSVFMKPNQMPEAGGDRRSNLSTSSCTSDTYQLRSNLSPNQSDTHWESTLFSSSLSELSSSTKLRLPRSDHLAFMSANCEEEPFESLEEIEARTIGDLLPDEDDFFAGVVSEVGHHNSRPNDLDDFDLFSSVGGMELDGDVFSTVGQRDGKRGSNVSVSSELPRGEVLSRILFVRNMDSIIEDCELRVLFEQYGDVRALHTAGKNRGFIMVAYYDIRAAQNATRALHGRLLRGRKLDIHYHIPKENPIKENTSEGAMLVNNLDSSISNEEFLGMVNSYGEIREVRHENSQICIDFFDIRAAEAALRGLNGLEIAGKQLKLTPSCPEGISFTPQLATDDVERSLSKMAFTNLPSGHIGRHFPGILASTSINGGSPVNSFIERHQSPNGLPPSTRIISASKPVDLPESGNPFDSSKMGIQSMPNLHPHSFHEYLDNFASGSPYKSSASPVNQGSFRANHNLWSNNSNTQQPNPSSVMMWPNSPSRVNTLPPQRIPPVTVFSRASPQMLNMSSSPVHHHIGSAPVLNSPFWDRRQAYAAESPKSSGFRMGSHGSMGFPDSSPSHPMEMSSHKVLRSSPQMSHLYNGRSSMLSVPNERYRNLSNRRSDSNNSSNAEKKLYELDVDRILRGEDSRTTLMIKNIPNKYTSKLLLAAIDEYCRGTYDFFYLPIDFKNKCNVGYAFINLTKPENIVPLYKAFNGKKWEKFNSEKVASLAYGRIQGQSALIAHFQNSSLMNEDKRCRPILFHTTGPNAGEQESFPMGSNIRSRPGKHRTSRIDNYTNREETDSF